MVETYFTALQRGAGSDGIVRQFMLVGRYCDVFEKRGEEWRVAKRTVAYDWVEEQTAPEGSDGERFGLRQPVGSAYPNDPVYQMLGRADVS